MNETIHQTCLKAKRKLPKSLKDKTSTTFFKLCKTEVSVNNMNDRLYTKRSGVKYKKM